MAIKIKAAPLVPQKEYLEIDPDGESWVYILPVTTRMDMMRGELLKTQELDSTGYLMRAVVNPITLQNKEIWLASPASQGDYKGKVCNIIVEYPPDEEGGEPKKVSFFDEAPEGGWTEATFYEELNKMPIRILANWVAKVRSVNPQWLYPFQ